MQNHSIKRFMTTQELSDFLGCNLKRAYELMHRRGFPSFKLGRIYKVDTVKLEEWLSRESKKEKL